MVTFELSTLAIIFFGTIAAAVIGILIERLLTWHTSNIITIQKLSDDFIKLSKEYYIPLEWVLREIAGETESGYEVRSKILFFKLARFLSLFESLKGTGVGYHFPKQTQEYKIIECTNNFLIAINLLIFRDDKEAMARAIRYYNKKSDILLFTENIENLQEYNTFESICENKKITDMLYKCSYELANSIEEGVAEEYKKWHKFEFGKQDTKQNISENVKDEKENILNLDKEISEKS
jgi:hypothetical protein